MQFMEYGGRVAYHQLLDIGKKVVPDHIHRMLANVQFSINDPRFFQKIFTTICKERKRAIVKDGDNLKRVCAEEYDELSRRVDATNIQGSPSVRNILRTRRLANLLISDKGEINIGILPRVITHLTNHLYSLGPQRQFDSLRQEHILSVIKLLRDSKDLVQQLRLIGKPHAHPFADQIIRDTLQLPAKQVITDAHARRAVLSAWMCFLRQNVGSCFATAPAIIVHDEQPELFLSDLKELLNTGRLKRTYGGNEYSVPLSVTWGAGDLRKPITLILQSGPQLSDVWNSPGIINAFDSVELFEPEVSLREKIVVTEKLIRQAFPEWDAKRQYVLTNAEEIIHRVLLQHLKITQQDLDAYNQRATGMIHSSLLMQVASTSTGMGGKGEACAHYYFMMERASNTFKALSENALLKSWEFTLASFSEIKSEFTRWNLYSSLGFSAEEPHGIGHCIYEVIKNKLDNANKKVAELQIEYEQMYAVVKQMEVRIRSAGDKDTQWMRMDYQNKMYDFQLIEEKRNEEHARAQLFTNLFGVLIQSYDKLFPQYFQEVYDADLHEVKVGPYDDSPAGFRLLYKHGRASTASWTKITNPHEFVEALANFFVSTESEMISIEQLEDIQSDITDIITSIVIHVKTREFLETAFQRMARAHKTHLIANPLDNLEKVPIKPWEYVSGGTMHTLVSSYYRRDQKPTEVARWIENPLELLVFIVDTMKHVPYKAMEPFLKDSNKSFLMYSPTHAFTLRPGLSPFKEAWQNEAFSYTWVRDNLILPRERFIEKIILDDEAISYLVEYFRDAIPESYRHNFYRIFSNLHGDMSPADLRDSLIDRIDHERGLQFMGRGVLTQDDIDGALYTLLPLFPAHQLEERFENILKQLPQVSQQIKDEMITDLKRRIGSMRRASGLMNAQMLQDICNAELNIGYEKTSLPFDGLRAVTEAAQALGYAMPAPIIFADTNWTKDFFAFVVNPGTSTLQFWRVDSTGRIGFPMSIWNDWLNGRDKEARWGILTRPDEYTPGVINAIRQPLVIIR